MQTGAEMVNLLGDSVAGEGLTTELRERFHRKAALSSQLQLPRRLSRPLNVCGRSRGDLVGESSAGEAATAHEVYSMTAGTGVSATRSGQLAGIGASTPTKPALCTEIQRGGCPPTEVSSFASPAESVSVGAPLIEGATGTTVAPTTGLPV